MSDEFKPQTPLEKLIQAEEDAKSYLLPISTKEWAEATGEKLTNYRMISIDVIGSRGSHFTSVLANNETRPQDYKDKEEQIQNYMKNVKGIDNEQKDAFSKTGVSIGVEALDVRYSVAKHMMISKGRAEGASVIVAIKTQYITNSDDSGMWYVCMTGVGLVPKQKSESEKMMDLHERLQDLHKNMGDDKDKQKGDYA